VGNSRFAIVTSGPSTSTASFSRIPAKNLT
jgi:hypothetical protein